jgi:hypothetical protein
MTREEKLATFDELTKLSGIKTGRQLAESCDKARLLIDHPASGREFTILGPDSVRGFWHLSAAVPIGMDFYTERLEYQSFELVVADTEFERIR